MDFICKLLGRAPSTPIFEDRPYFPPPTRPSSPADGYDVKPTRPEQERFMRRLLKAREPANIARGERLREELFGADARVEYKALLRSAPSTRLGTTAGALSRLVRAETKRVRHLDRSPLFDPAGDVSQISYDLLLRIAQLDDGAKYIRDPRVREAFTRVMKKNDETQAALIALTLSALSIERSHDAHLVRWLLRAMGVDRPEITQAQVPVHAARYIAPKVRERLCEALARAEAAWMREDFTTTVNALRPVAQVGVIPNEEARAIFVQAMGDAWPRAKSLAADILRSRTEDDDYMRVFHVTRACAGWPSVLPLLDHKLSEAQTEDIEALAWHFMREYGDKNYGAPASRRALKAMIEIMKANGQGKSEVVRNARAAVKYRPPVEMPYYPEVHETELYTACGDHDLGESFAV